jgi:hypothetical protein
VMRRGWRIGVVVLGLVVTGGFGAFAAFGGESSQYYVDGARPVVSPSEGATVEEACVPYSTVRPDLHICKDIPDGYQAGSAPGGADAYPDICALTLERYQFEGQLPVPSAIEGREDDGDPTVDASSCWVVPMGTYPDQPVHASEYSVSFALKDGSGNVHVDLDLEGGA